jgi:hypothetical protein
VRSPPRGAALVTLANARWWTCPHPPPSTAAAFLSCTTPAVTDRALRFRSRGELERIVRAVLAGDTEADGALEMRARVRDLAPDRFRARIIAAIAQKADSAIYRSSA